MGRNNLSTTQLAHKITAELMSLAEMLSPRDRRVMEKFCEFILQQRVSISNATELLPLEAAIVMIQLEEHKKNTHEFSELYQELQDLRHEIERLKTAI